jgi:trimeric autotransporter adhesin
MSRTKLLLSVWFLLICSAVSLSAQQAALAAANAVVPPVVKFSGVLTDTNNKPVTGTVGVTFSLYQQSQGGAPLWVETQNVIADKTGRYTVMLGSSTSQGLPSDVFNSGEARWLGVQVQGQAEQPRTVLMSVPYALKAADAETVGGLPASAFLKAAGSGSATGSGTGQAVAGITGSGTANHITKWLSPTKLGNSNIFDGAGNVGIATTSPGATLDVNGSAIVRDNATVNGSLNVNSVNANTTVDGLTALFGQSNSGVGTVGISLGSNVGILGQGGTDGVDGEGGSGYGVFGSVGSSGFDGVHGESSSEHSGVAGLNSNSSSGYGVYGQAASVNGIGGGFYNTTKGDALFTLSFGGGYAAFLDGNVEVDGNLSKAGGSFKIDHPLDPANKYLYHSFVESPDMMNIYNGNVTTDARGHAVVQLPEWFETLNRDFRYQLTVIGQFAQAIVASEVSKHQFTIKTDKPNVRVSWQVTGIRQDAWANAHRIPVEASKAPAEQGFYLHPELFGAPAEKSIAVARHPMILKLPKQQAAKLKTPTK